MAEDKRGLRDDINDVVNTAIRRVAGREPQQPVAPERLAALTAAARSAGAREPERVARLIPSSCDLDANTAIGALRKGLPQLFPGEKQSTGTAMNAFLRRASGR